MYEERVSYTRTFLECMKRAKAIFEALWTHDEGLDYFRGNIRFKRELRLYTMALCISERAEVLFLRTYDVRSLLMLYTMPLMMFEASLGYI